MTGILALLFLPVVLSGATAFFFKNEHHRKLKLVLAFSGAYLFALCITHLIPSLYESKGPVNIGIFILVGFFLQILLEFFSQGIEHGHMHHHHHENARFPLVLMLGLCVHSFLEGMPLNRSGAVQNALLFGITLHNIPISFALVTMMLESRISIKKTVVCLMVFGLMAPLGFLTSFVLQNYSSHDVFAYYPIIMAVVIGIFLHISTTILFESSEEHRFNLYKLVVILAGAGLSLCV